MNMNSHQQRIRHSIIPPENAESKEKAESTQQFESEQNALSLVKRMGVFGLKKSPVLSVLSALVRYNEAALNKKNCGL